MDCVEVQKNISRFVNDELGMQEMEAFLRHMEECSECREEYDVYYTLIMGMKLLDEEESIFEKFHLDSSEKLETAWEALQKKKRFILTARFLFVCLISVMVFGM